MAFNLGSWKARFRALTSGWSRQTLVQLGITSTYAFICLNALQPVVEAAKSGEAFALAQLRLLAGSVGVNLLSNTIQRWKDRSAAAKAIDDVLRSPSGGQFARSMAPVLKELDAIRSAGRLLSDEDRSWFEQAIRKEVEESGVWPYHEEEIEAGIVTILAPTRVTGSTVGGQASIGARIDVHPQISITKVQPSTPQAHAESRSDSAEVKPSTTTEDDFWGWLFLGGLVILLLAGAWRAYSESLVSLVSPILAAAGLAVSALHFLALLSHRGRRFIDFLLLLFLGILWTLGTVAPLLGVYSPLYGRLQQDANLTIANAFQALGTAAGYAGLLVLPPLQFSFARVYRKTSRMKMPWWVEAWLTDKRAEALFISTSSVLIGSVMSSGLISRLMSAAGLLGF